jgi:Mrp family chromosome partitioning ATPase
LLDHLAGKASLDQTIQKTAHDNLWIIPGGTRFRQGPELLMAQGTKVMMEELKGRFDAVIIDTPPLGAGVDAFVLATAANNLVVVLRAGESDRKLAEAKLDLVDRLPVRVLGTVLNATNGGREYQYYAYIDGYATQYDEEGAPALAGSVPGYSLTTKPR